MFQALKLCADAVVLKPRMSRYAEVARSVRALMRDLTPLVEPLSLDEAYLDLSGTERLHGVAPAEKAGQWAGRHSTGSLSSRVSVARRLNFA
jgi:DNA polymerase-4